jgi:hypothetical protein
MALNGTGLRFIDSEPIPAGTPGGKNRCTVQAQPTGNYPALGELISDLLVALWALGSNPKVPTGVRPSNVTVTDSLGHVWTFDRAQGTAGSLRNWTAVSNTPTEHATAAYDGNEASGVLTIVLEFPLYSDLSR